MMVAVGAFNLSIAVIVLLFLPDRVESARFLNAEEKTTIHRKLFLDQGGSGAKVFKMASLAEIFTDFQNWSLGPRLLYILRNNINVLFRRFVKAQ